MDAFHISGAFGGINSCGNWAGLANGGAQEFKAALPFAPLSIGCLSVLYQTQLDDDNNDDDDDDDDDEEQEEVDDEDDNKDDDDDNDDEDDDCKEAEEQDNEHDDDDS